MTGKTVLHYEILDKLGEGGMGVVYEARDLNSPNQSFVVVDAFTTNQVLKYNDNKKSADIHQIINDQIKYGRINTLIGKLSTGFGDSHGRVFVFARRFAAHGRVHRQILSIRCLD